MKYTVPEIPPSLNKFAGRQNTWQYRTEKQRWKELVWVFCRYSGLPLNRATVTLTYFFPTKIRHDPDNYSGKMILDGLTAAGIIEDDSFANIELVLKGSYDKANPRVEIEVTAHERAIELV